MLERFRFAPKDLVYNPARMPGGFEVGIEEVLVFIGVPASSTSYLREVAARGRQLVDAFAAHKYQRIARIGRHQPGLAEAFNLFRWQHLGFLQGVQRAQSRRIV